MQNLKPTSNGQNGAVQGAQVLNDIAALIRRHLVCDEHQLAILTLWSACTQCHHHFFTAPYLHICSPQPHCGRSLCLGLLCDLCNADVVFTGVPAAPLLNRLIQSRSLDVINERSCPMPFTVLIDDCHHSFGPSERQPLIALLNSGSEVSSFFSWGNDDYTLFGPKALSGNSSLPRSLAARCIPVQLRRPKPSEKFVRYPSGDMTQEFKSLRDRLRRWLQQVAPLLGEARNSPPQDLPPAISPGQSKCAEPLIYIADAAGGPWPSKIRSALVAAFKLAESNPELQILADLRFIFGGKNNPEYLATSDLIAQLRLLDGRPWSAWTGKSGLRLANHLRPFGIMSRRLILSREDDFVGYLFKDFQDAWERYLPASSSVLDSQPIEVPSDAGVAHEEAEAEAETYALAAD